MENKEIAKQLRVNKFEVLRPEITDLDHNVYVIAVEFDGKEYHIEYSPEDSGTVALQPAGDRDQLVMDIEEKFNINEYTFDSWEIIDLAVARVIKFEEEEEEEEEDGE